MLYLYFAANANGFTLALSPAAIRQTIGMASSTYRDKFLKLVDKGYLIQRGESSTYDFYEIPQRVARSDGSSASDACSFPANVQSGTNPVGNETAEDIEININNTNRINTGGKEQAPSASSKEFVF